jgi:hypothetical protein
VLFVRSHKVKFYRQAGTIEKKREEGGYTVDFLLLLGNEHLISCGLTDYDPSAVVAVTAIATIAIALSWYHQLAAIL